MREGWVETTLGEVCAITKGESPTEKTSPGEFPLVVTAAERRTSATYQFDEPAVCIPMVSSTGHGHASLKRVHFESGRFAVANIIAACTAKDASALHVKYLWLLLDHHRDELIVPLMRGTANMSLGIRDLLGIRLVLPPFTEQRRIVDVIESVDAYIAALEQRADAARTARAALLHDLLSNPGSHWTQVQLLEVATIKNGKYIPKSEYVEDGMYWIYGSNSVMGRFNDSTVEVPHVIMAAVGAYAGSVRYSAEPSWINNNAFGIVPINDEIDAHFLFIWLNFNLDLSRVVGGTGQPYVQRPHLMATNVALLSKVEQRNIVELSASIDTVIRDSEAILGDALRLRSALLSDLLSGNHEIPASYDELLGAA